MRLTRYLQSDLALTGVSGTDAESVLSFLASHLSEHVSGVERDALASALVEREEQHTTALGQGVAIPHATLPGPEAPVLMVARADDPVPFGPPDAEPVWLFFVLVSPPGREREHIKLLARICRLVRAPGFLDGLRGAPDASGLVAAIQRMDEEHV